MAGTLGKLKFIFGADITEFQAASDKVEKKAEDSAQKIKEKFSEKNGLGSMFSGAGIAITGFIAGLGLVAGAVEGFSASVEAAGEAMDALDKYGADPEKFYAMSNAVAQLGGDFNKVTPLIPKFQEFLKDAADSSSDKAKLLAELGLSVKELQDTDPAEVMGVLAKSLSEIEDPATRARVGTELMGKGFAEAAQDFYKLTDAQEVNTDVTIDHLKVLDDFGDAMGGAKGKAKDFAMYLSAEALFAFTDIKNAIFGTSDALGIDFTKAASTALNYTLKVFGEMVAIVQFAGSVIASVITAMWEGGSIKEAVMKDWDKFVQRSKEIANAGEKEKQAFVEARVAEQQKHTQEMENQKGKTAALNKLMEKKEKAAKTEKEQLSEVQKMLIKLDDELTKVGASEEDLMIKQAERKKATADELAQLKEKIHLLNEAKALKGIRDTTLAIKMDIETSDVSEAVKKMTKDAEALAKAEGWTLEFSFNKITFKDKDGKEVDPGKEFNKAFEMANSATEIKVNKDLVTQLENIVFATEQIGKSDIDKKIADINKAFANSTKGLDDDAVAKLEERKKAVVDAVQAQANAERDFQLEKMKRDMVNEKALVTMTDKERELFNMRNSLKEQYPQLSDTVIDGLIAQKAELLDYQKAFADNTALAQQFADVFYSGIEKLIDGTGDLGDVFDSLGKQIAKTAAQVVLLDPLKDFLKDMVGNFGKERAGGSGIFDSLISMFGKAFGGGGGGDAGGGGFWSSIGSSIGSFFGFGGAGATGTDTYSNMSYLVGEKGPEVWTGQDGQNYLIANQNGHVSPMSDFAVGGGNSQPITIQQTIQVTVAGTSEQIAKQIADASKQAVKQAVDTVQAQAMRGGNFARALGKA